MSKYKKLMLYSGIMQKEILINLQRIDPRIDKSLLSKIVHDLCLPTKQALDNICATLHCDVLDIYDESEINLLPEKPTCTQATAVATDVKCKDSKLRSSGYARKTDVYNLTVGLDRTMALRVFSKDSLSKLGYSGVSDFVRKSVADLARRLDEIENNKIVEDGR